MHKEVRVKNPLRPHSKYALGLLVLLLTLFSVHTGVVEAAVVPGARAADAVVFDQADPGVRAVMAVQDRHTGALMANPGVVGTATGLGPDARPVVLVFISSYKAARGAAIPARLENVPVIVRISGEIKALTHKGNHPGGGGGGGDKGEEVDPTARFSLPVPIGVSTGHPNITAGTIGARVTDGTDVYALSNNHVYADENNASIGDNVLQPGVYDDGKDPDDAIGVLDDFEPIDFVGDNVIDAAIALSSTTNLGNATPSDGYGRPRSDAAVALLNQRVMKYGRTTGLTKGSVYAVNATINVGYGSGVAVFKEQIIITPGKFSAGGDSGSLIVVQRGANARRPIGLLFAGSSMFTVANPIGAVLTRFGVTIDGD
jgi:hypothetical protein